MRHAVLLLIALGCFSSAALRTEAALVVQGYDPDRHDRFANSSEFVGATFDWSGVGLSNTGRWGTLVSPSYIISATHLPASGSMRFYATNDPAGPFVERNVGASTAIAGTDLYLARLSAPISVGSGITSYEIATFGSADSVNREILTFGLSDGQFGAQANQRLGRNVIDQAINNFSAAPLGASVGDVIVYDYNTTNGLGADEARVATGDSGGPSFTIVQGRPTIVGVHWFEFAADANQPRPGSGDTFVSHYVSALNAAMAQLTPQGETTETVRTLSVTAVPEPTSLALGSLALLLTALPRTRPNLRVLFRT